MGKNCLQQYGNLDAKGWQGLRPVMSLQIRFCVHLEAGKQIKLGYLFSPRKLNVPENTNDIANRNLLKRAKCL